MLGQEYRLGVMLLHSNSCLTLNLHKNINPVQSQFSPDQTGLRSGSPGPYSLVFLSVSVFRLETGPDRTVVLRFGPRSQFSGPCGLGFSTVSKKDRSPDWTGPWPVYTPPRSWVKNCIVRAAIKYTGNSIIATMENAPWQVFQSTFQLVPTVPSVTSLFQSLAPSSQDSKSRISEF
jgi:hypothetical protein